MTSSRLLAIFVAACALVASALIAIPIDGAEAPDSYTDSIPSLASGPKHLIPQNTESSEEAHAAVPRLWLGRP